MTKHSAKDVPPPGLTRELKHTMMNYHWPGNVRELENVVRRFLILRDADMLARELRNASVRRSEPVHISAPAKPRAEVASVAPGARILQQVTKAKQQAEVDAILAALNSTRWNRKRAAELLEIDYKALLYKMKKLGVEDRPAPIDVESDGGPRSVSAAGGY